MLPTIHEAAADLRAGRFTPVDLLAECLAAVDRHEPRVRAWVLLDRDGARADAERLTRELKEGRDRGPLHGIPVGVKDIFDVADWPTAAGSKHWANAVARADCDAVARLRHAGAVVLGKTVTTPYACFDPSETRNPWHPGRTPGGSSSGSAAAVACGMVPFALATQTGGSVTRPAAYCGVCGLKPTFGRLSMAGVVPLAPSLDHAGVVAGCAADLALAYRALAAGRVQDPLAAGDPAPLLTTAAGLFHDLATPAVREATARALRTLPVETVVLPPAFAEALAAQQTIVCVEAATVFGDRFRRRPDDFPPKVTEVIEHGLRTPAPVYARALATQRQLTAEVEAVIGGGVLVTPATPDPAPGPETTGSPAFNAPWSLTGHPTVSLPCGWTDDGLPLSVQLVGGRGRDAALLRAAAEVERLLGFARREPPVE